MKQESQNGKVRLQLSPMFPDADKCLLDDLMGFVPITDGREHRTEHDGLIPFEQASKRLFVGIPYSSDQLFVVFRHHQVRAWRP